MIGFISCFPLRGLVVRGNLIVYGSLVMFGSLGMGLISWLEVHCEGGVRI